MGTYILLFILMMCLIIAFYNGGNYLISPALVMAGSFFLAVLFAALNPQWDYEMSAKTVVVVTLTVVMFMIGSVIPLKVRLERINIFHETEGYTYSIKNNIAIITILLQWGMLLFYVLFLLQIGGGISASSIKNARTWMLYNNVPNIYGHINHISFSIAVIYIFLLARQVIVDRNKKHRGIYLLIIVPYILNEILGSSRSGIIYLLGYILTIVVYFMQTKMKQMEVSKSGQKQKVISIAVKVIVIVFASFIILGNLTGKTRQLGIWNMVSTYFGGSIYNLNYYVGNVNEYSSPAFGYFTFPLLNSLKGAFGISVPTLENYYFPMHLIPTRDGTSTFSPTNLYTCITSVMTDYGFGGMLLFYSILGILYGSVYKLAHKSKNAGLSLIYYGFIIMPLVGASASYLFGMMIFAPYGIYRAIYIFILFKLCVRKTYVERMIKRNETEDYEIVMEN